MNVRIRISPLWERTREELALRALERSAAVRALAEQRTEEEWRARAEHGRMARVIRRAEAFVRGIVS